MQNYNSTLNTDSISESAREVDLYDYPKFLAAFQKAYSKDDQISLCRLETKAPDFFRKAFLSTVPDLTEMEYSRLPFPILSSETCTTVPCIYNMVFFLTGCSSAGRAYLPYLLAHAKYKQTTHPETGRLEYLFLPSSLWEDFFSSEPTLSLIIRSQKIFDLTELIERTRDFCAKAACDYMPPGEFI